MEKTGLGRYCVFGTCYYQETIACKAREVKHFFPSKKFVAVLLTKSNAI